MCFPFTILFKNELYKFILGILDMYINQYVHITLELDKDYYLHKY